MITDLAPYRDHLEGLDLTDAQKLDLVNALWAIAENIIDTHLGLNQLEMQGKELDSPEANDRVEHEAVIASERRNSLNIRCASAESDVRSSSDSYGRGNVRACSGREPKGVHDRDIPVFLPPRSPTSSD